MMHIQNIPTPKLSFSKSCCDGKNNSKQNINIILASVGSDSFNNSQPLKKEIKLDLATRIIALQQQMIEKLQNRV